MKDMMSAPFSEKLFAVIRIILGGFFVYYGSMKFGMIGDHTTPNGVMGLGGVMALFGVNFFWPVFWGYAAIFAEFVGGILLILGLWTRFAAFLTSFTMIIAFGVILQFTQGNPLPFLKALEMILLIYLSMLYMYRGGGLLSLDYKYGLCPVSKWCQTHCAMCYVKKKK